MDIRGHVDRVTNHGVVGWIADADQPDGVVEVVIVVDGVPRATGPASEIREGLDQIFPGATGRYQFTYEFLPRLTVSRPHQVEVLVKHTQTLMPNGRWTLPAQGVRKSRPPPIILTSTGRAGTTLLMHEFAARPSIVVADAYPYEVKLASYYASAFDVLTHQRMRTDMDSITFAEEAFDRLRLGPNPWNQSHLHDMVGGPYTESLFTNTMPARLAALFQDTVNDFYEGVRIAQGKSSVSYFAEKSVIHREMRPAMRRLFGEFKELILVRDPRDFLCSARSFWNINVEQGLSTLRYQTEILNDIRREAASDVLFVRYEDLILNPEPARDAIYDFLEIDRDGMTEVATTPDIRERHATTGNPVESIGRWKRDLDNAIAGICVRDFAEFMAAFHYEP